MTTARTIAATIRIRNRIGTPITVLRPMAVSAEGAPEIVTPPVHTSARPLNSCIVPRVVRMGVIPTTLTSTPFTAPSSAPMPRPARMMSPDMASAVCSPDAVDTAV